VKTRDKVDADSRGAPRNVDDARHIAAGREVVRIESQALSELLERIGSSFAEAVRAIVASPGTVVVLGLGKSGIVARKLAATLASTGTRAVFLHPADAAHGDVGMVAPGDVGVVVSKSGEGEELLRIIPTLRELGVTVIAITGAPSSSLASRADIVLDSSVEREACPMDLVPTASTTAAIALADALAVAVLREKEVDRELLATLHPGGALGRRLLLRVRDVMHTGNELPCVSETALMKDAIVEIANKRLGMTTVVDGSGRLSGVLTDGDLKRILMVRPDILETPVKDVMTKTPRTIGPGELLATALARMENNLPSPITSLIIVDSEGRPEGVVHIHDCLRARE